MVKCRSNRIYKSESSGENRGGTSSDRNKLERQQTKAESRTSELDIENVLRAQCTVSSPSPNNQQDVSEDEFCEVDWDSRSPVTLTQVARYKIHSVDISNFVTDTSDDYENMPSSRTPPLLGLWMDDSNRNVGKLIGQRRLRTRGVGRKKGRPSGIKKSVSTKDMFLKLASVLHDNKNVSDAELLEPATENPQRRSARLSQKPSTSSVSSSSSVETSFDLFDASNLNADAADTAPNIPQSEAVLLKRTFTRKPDICSPTIVRKKTSDHVTPKRPNPGISRPSPLMQFSPNQSLEDVWTDEELFADDSFLIKATQMASEPRTRTPTGRAQKRKTPCTSPLVKSDNNICFQQLAGPSVSNSVQPKVISTTASSSQREIPKSPFQSYYNRNKTRTEGTKLQPKQTFPSKPKKFTFVKPQVTVRPSIGAQSTEQINKDFSQRTQCHIKSGTNGLNITSSTVLRPHSVKAPEKAPAPAPMIPKLGSVKINVPSNKIHCVQMPVRKAPTKPAVRRSSFSPPPLDMSLSDDLLASLAEPDDLLDSQVIAGSGGSPSNMSVLHTTVTDMKPSATSTQLFPVAKPRKAPDNSDGFPDEDDDPELLALLEIVESSQDKKEKNEENGGTKSVSHQLGCIKENNKTVMTKSAKSNTKPVIQSHSSFKPLNFTTGRVNYAPLADAPSAKAKVAPNPPLNSITTTSGNVNLVSKAPKNNAQASPAGQTASQKCTKEEIERKKQEALKRRQNRLKLSSKPR